MSLLRFASRALACPSLLFMAVCLGGCGWVKNSAVDMLVDSMGEGADSLRAHFDWETAGHGAAAGIIQLEALYGVRPVNENLALGLVKSYMAYAYGWVMDAHEVALAEEDFALADHHQQRAYLMYTRAKRIAMKVVRQRDEDFDAQLKQHPEELMDYLRQRYTDPEEDLAPLFWLMMSWSSAVNNSDDGTEFTEMPFIRTIAERIIELDETYEAAGALVFMGGLLGSYSPALGGDPEKAQGYFERALAITERKNHLIHVNYAKLYAVTVQDKELYLKLLREVVEAPDQGDEFRMSNKVARRRAYRYLKQVDDLFF